MHLEHLGAPAPAAVDPSPTSGSPKGGHPRKRGVRYSNVPSWAWPGSGHPWFGTWRQAWGRTFRFRAHLIHFNWRRYGL